MHRRKIAGLLGMIVLLAATWGVAGTTAPPRPCAADLQKFCQTVPARQKMVCLQEHRAQLSAPCQARLQAARETAQDVREACEDDVARLCPAATPGRPLLQCLRQHRTEVSADCQAAISQARPANKPRP